MAIGPSAAGPTPADGRILVLAEGPVWAHPPGVVQVGVVRSVWVPGVDREGAVGSESMGYRVEHAAVDLGAALAGHLDLDHFVGDGDLGPRARAVSVRLALVNRCRRALGRRSVMSAAPGEDNDQHRGRAGQDGA